MKEIYENHDRERFWIIHNDDDDFLKKRSVEQSRRRQSSVNEKNDYRKRAVETSRKQIINQSKRM